MDAAHSLGCALFAEDPLQYNVAWHQYERVFQSACDKRDFPFAFECLRYILVQNHALSAMPLFVELTLETFRQNKIKPHATIMNDHQRIILWMAQTKSLLQKEPYCKLHQADLLNFVNTLSMMLWNNGDMEAFQKKIRTLSFLKKIRDANLEGIRLYHKLLPGFHALSSTSIWECLTPLLGVLKDMQILIKTYLPKEETTELEKEWQALTDHWKPMWMEAEEKLHKKKLRYLSENVPIHEFSLNVKPKTSLERSEARGGGMAKIKEKGHELKIAKVPAADPVAAPKAFSTGSKGAKSKRKKAKASKTAVTEENNKAPIEKKK